MQMVSAIGYVKAWMGSTNHEEHIGCIKSQFGSDLMKTGFHANSVGVAFFYMVGFLMMSTS